VFEVDPADMADPTLMQTLLQKGMLGPNQQLSDMLSPTTLEKLKIALQEAGLPAAQFMRFRPWFLTLTLSTQQMLTLGYQPDYGVEVYLMQEKSAATQVLELESMNEQLSFLEALDGEAYLEYTLNTMEQGKQMMGDMAKAWACADKPMLTELLVNSLNMDGVDRNELERLKSVFLYDRNEKMADKIEEYIQSGNGSYFVVVGAAHYLGDKSVVDLLQQKDYKVEAVKLK
jgi:hypothetical protein